MIKDVKEKLWRFGYSVTEVAGKDFDLLVDKKIRVRVEKGQPDVKRIDRYSRFDVVAFAFKVRFVDKVSVVFLKNGLLFYGPYDVFGRPKKSLKNYKSKK